MSYDRWKLERRHLKETGQPFPEERRHDRSLDPAEAWGYWRQHNARTRADTPIAIWPEQDATLVKFGNMRDPASAEAVEAFMSKGFLKCSAVTRDEWTAALDAGKWADGKIIRMPTAEEQADIIPTITRDEGGNQLEGDALWEQVRDALVIGAETIKTIGAIDNMTKAERLAGVIETMSAAGKIGEAERKRLKKPHDDAAAEVQNKWAPMLTEGSTAISNAKTAVQRFRDAEERRLREEERQRRDAEEKRIREEKEAELREQARQAEAMGMGEAPSDEEIAAQAAEVAAAEVQSMPAANTTVRVGTTTGRGVSKAKITKGRITDVAKFFDAIKDHEQTKDFLQTIADRLARNGVPVPGMVSYRE